MTNKEAISCLVWLQTAHSAEYAQALDMAIKALEINGDLVSKSVFDQIKWERDVAISQLHDLGYELGEKPRTDGDLISRKDVINMFNTMDRYKADKLILQDTDRKFPGNEVFIVDDCYELLEQLPTYSAEQKTGHWIKYGIPRCDEQHYKCTLCGYYINFGRWGELYTKEFKYCPNCGVRMEGEKE